MKCQIVLDNRVKFIIESVHLEIYLYTHSVHHAHYPHLQIQHSTNRQGVCGAIDKNMQPSTLGIKMLLKEKPQSGTASPKPQTPLTSHCRYWKRQTPSIAVLCSDNQAHAEISRILAIRTQLVISHNMYSIIPSISCAPSLISPQSASKYLTTFHYP
jgi:hypothetical protein